MAERHRTRSSSWGERDFKLLGDNSSRETKNKDKGRSEEEERLKAERRIERRREEEQRREEERRMEEEEELLMQEDELRREADIAMQSYYTYGRHQALPDPYHRDNPGLNSSR